MIGTLILGGGPGGTGPLVWAAQNDRLEPWLARGVALVEQSGAMGGTIGRYYLNSDSLGASYLSCLDSRPVRDVLAPVRESDFARQLETMRFALPPLSLVGSFLDRLCGELQNMLAQSAVSSFYPRCAAHRLLLCDDGSVSAEIKRQDGTVLRLDARTAIVAVGGRQHWPSGLGNELVPGVRLSDINAAKLISSDTILQPHGLAHAERILAAAPRRRALILGGSHSAFSVAWALLNCLPGIGFANGDITIALRKQPPIYYDSWDLAQADSYPVTENDICPVTHRVNRCGGLRGDGRALWRRLTGRLGTDPEMRVSMSPFPKTAAELRGELDAAALIVAAFGYRAALLPIFDAEGRRLLLAADEGAMAVGGDGRLLLADGRAIPNVFGIGLGTGYTPQAWMGGEPSFVGQQNSLWMYQNDLGRTIHDGVMAALRAAMRVSPVRYRSKRPRTMATTA